MSKLKIKNLDTNEFEELPLIQGERGERGYSAYEIAVKNGYKGTEAEWTNAFLSPDGYYGKTEIDNKENNLKAENEYLNSVIEQAFTPVEKEGTSINYDNTINARFKDIKLCGDTTQNGTPTPDTPVPVNVVSGDNTIDICGKNLFNKNNVRAGYRFGSDGEYYASTGYNATEYIRVQPSTLYSVSWSMVWDEVVCTYDINKTFIRRLQSGTNFTTSASEYYIRANVSNAHLDTAQIEKGTATTYEPYIGNSYPLYLGDIELCKIGDYQDRIYKDNGKWYLEKQIGKDVLDGSETYNLQSDKNKNTNIFMLTKADGYSGWSKKGVLSSHFLGVNDGAGNVANTIRLNIRGQMFICLPNSVSIAQSVDTFKAYLQEQYNAGTPVIVYYTLKTPIATEITDTTLLEQLEELAGAKTYAGETNIVATSDGLTIIPKTTALTK